VNRQLTAWFGNSGRYTLLTQSAILSVTQQITGLLTHVLVGVAAISVLVGGIGMLNVMLISVSERVREIGLRKSLGAKRRDLLMQFLVEAVIISLSGGTLGVGAGVAASLALTSRFHIGAAINPAVPVLALAACVVLGILFGIYPAFRAARMAPAEALRCD
jgi:putative ABC transport system permease protein